MLLLSRAMHNDVHSSAVYTHYKWETTQIIHMMGSSQRATQCSQETKVTIAVCDNMNESHKHRTLGRKARYRRPFAILVQVYRV